MKIVRTSPIQACVWTVEDLGHTHPFVDRVVVGEIRSVRCTLRVTA